MNELQVFNCEQGTPEWKAARLGIPTASEFHTVLAKGKGITRQTYMNKLAGEILTGEQMYSYSNDHMERGKVMEDEARKLYVLVTDADVKQVGFLRRGDIGASPDSMIDEEGLLEIKTKLAHLQIECLKERQVPSEHMAQLQGQLFVSQRKWVDFVSYWPGLPIFIKRVPRDETYIARIKVEVEAFNKELATLVEQIRNYKP